MSETLTITKERVLAAATKCGQAKATLQTLFPEAFKTDWRVGDVFEADDGGFVAILSMYPSESWGKHNTKERPYFLGGLDPKNIAEPFANVPCSEQEMSDYIARRGFKRVGRVIIGKDEPHAS